MQERSAQLAPSARRIMIVDDDPDIRAMLSELLRLAGYNADEQPSGRRALERLFEVSPDLVLLDVGMPELDGWQTLERIRDVCRVPVIMLTARSGELERVRGLKTGADDYVSKPFGRQELLARIEAVLRRYEETPSRPDPVYEDARVRIDLSTRSVELDGTQLLLTPLEFRMLLALVRHQDEVLSHERLLELVWGGPGAASRDQVKLYIGYLRRKLGSAGVDLIATTRGFGYRYLRP